MGVASLKMPFVCVVNGIFTFFLRNIHSGERFIGIPPKEVLYLDVGIFFVVKCQCFWHIISTIFAKKNLQQFCFTVKKCCVVFCKPNKL